MMAAPDPQETIAKLLTARGELDVLIDMITNLEASKYLDYGIASMNTGASALHEAAVEGVVEIGRRQRQLNQCALRLREGSAALRDIAKRDNLYLAELGSLQRYWRVRVNPLLPEFADAPFSVDLDLWDNPAAISSSSDTIPPLCSLRTLLPITKDMTGMARVEVDHEDGELLVAEGWESIHDLLKVEQSNIFWRMALNALDMEIRSLPSDQKCEASSRFNHLLLSPSSSLESMKAKASLLDWHLRMKAGNSQEATSLAQVLMGLK